MRKLLFLLSLAACFVILPASVSAQKPNPETIERDSFLETDAKHNLEVAQQYFRTKKAYKAVLLRFEETFAAYPEFSRMDEFLYIAGMSSFYLSQNKGKQKLEAAMTEAEKKKFEPGRLREEAIAYLSMVVDKYPQSKFRPEAEKTLSRLKKQPADS
jgi:outer membrane protein assembly factor BamD (BamD/ComL family)